MSDATAARGHEFVEHTADLGLRAWAPDLGGAFAEAARALFEHMVDLSEAAPTDAHEVSLEAESPARLLFAFLDDALFRHQTELLVFSRFDVRVERVGDVWRASGALLGEPLDASRHGHVHEVKAITFHDLVVREGPPAEVFVLVDI